MKVGDEFLKNGAEIPICTAVVKRALSHIEFICKQLSRFKRMSPKEFESYARGNPLAIFCQIPGPDGKGYLRCGHLAWEKFGLLSDLVIKLDENVCRRVSRQFVMDATVKIFSKRILVVDVEINQEIAGLLLHDVLSVLKGSLIVTEHYLPCVLFPRGGPDEFSIGPVTLTRRKKFFKDRKAAFRSSIEAETASHIKYVDKQVDKGFLRERLHSEYESRLLVRRLQARAIRTYRAYPWIASVKISNCDEHTSRHQGERAVEMAIHVIRIILGGESTRKIRLAWSQSPVLRTGRSQESSATPDDHFAISSAITSSGVRHPSV